MKSGLGNPGPLSFDAQDFWLTKAGATIVQLVLDHLAAKGVAMDPKNFGGPGLVTVGAVQNTFDEAFFELSDCLVEQDAALHHLRYQAFQLISHVSTLRCRIGIS